MTRISLEEYLSLKKKEIKKGSKYRNKKTLYNGEMYDSIKEARYAQDLDLLLKATKSPKLLSWERQPPFPCIVSGKKICVYRADFKAIYEDRVEIIDVKGFKTSIYKLKKKLVEALYGIEIIEK